MPEYTMLISPVGAELYPLFSCPNTADEIKNFLISQTKTLLPAADITIASPNTLCVQAKLSSVQATEFAVELKKCGLNFTPKGRLPIYLRTPQLIITQRTAPPTTQGRLLPLLWLEHAEKLQPQLPPNAGSNELLNILSVRRPEVACNTICAIALVDILGRAAGFSDQELQNLKTAALWQDSGMLFIPRALRFAAGPLSLPQKAQLDAHVQLSAELAGKHGLSNDVQQLILQHHTVTNNTSAALLKVINHWLDLQTEWPWRPAVSAAAAHRLTKKPTDTAVELLNQHQKQLPTPEMIYQTALNAQLNTEIAAVRQKFPQGVDTNFSLPKTPQCRKKRTATSFGLSKKARKIPFI